MHESSGKGRTGRSAKGASLDAPESVADRAARLGSKGLLRRIYEEWYGSLVSTLPPGPGAVLELGSGGGFLADVLPAAITSDVVWAPGLSVTLDAHSLPFRPGSLKAILMTCVFHHLPRPKRFLEEAAGLLGKGGVVAMVEPWVTGWSRLVYGHLHPEPFDPEAVTWTTIGSGRLTGSNQALPWIVFERDRELFGREFPQFELRSLDLFMPVAYLLSGGVSFPSLLPGVCFRGVRFLEGRLGRWRRRLAMFARVTLVRR